MLQKFGKNIVVPMLLFSFVGKTYSSFDTTHIPKEMFESILNELPNSKTIPITGEEWSSEEMLRSFGAASIAKELFDFIRSILPEGKILLELGSGWASGQLSEYYTVYSIEHNPRWLNKYNTHYIYTPIKGRWYDPTILKAKLPDNYDFILVDGPPGYQGCRTNRYGFYIYLDLFKTDLPIVFDDVDRKTEYSLMMQVGQKLQRDVVIFNLGPRKKKFGVISYGNYLDENFLFPSSVINPS